MDTALFIAAYAVIALLCVYLEARVTGDAGLGPLWMVWPVMLPVLALAWLFDTIGELGERHSR